MSLKKVEYPRQVCNTIKIKWEKWYFPLFPQTCNYYFVPFSNYILAVFFESRLRWIRSDGLSIRRAEKEWMAGRLPVKSLRVSTSSLACFCHKLLFGLDLICPATPCTALCRPSSNLQHGSDSGCFQKKRCRPECIQPQILEVDVFLWALSVPTENQHVKCSLIPMS